MLNQHPERALAFEPVDQRPDLAAMEERVLERWRDRQVFRRSLERTAGGPPFRFYDGPPTANGRPGVHHVEARVFKDVFPRYRTMKGQFVARKAGWDCHGIPVEVEVEKELGLGSKPQIEEYGVAEFNARCRESVTRYVEEFERLTERIGYWVDTDEAYWTMSTEYIESVWWSLKTLFDRGLIYQDDRVVPYCPRCGTALSDHEVAQGYAETDDPSIYVRFPILTGPLAAEGADLLIWTTMPWTLVPATLAVVGEGIRYVLARGGHAGERPVVLAAERMGVLGEGAEVVRDVALDELTGARYRAPFNFVGPGSADNPDGDPSSWRFVVAGDFVRTDDGTGIVHTGAAFGEDDMRAAREHGAPIVKPVDLQGRFDERIGPYAGMFIRDADPLIIEDVRRAGLLLRAGTHTHAFPFCWRCETPLLYYAKPSWYIATTRFRERLLEENALVDWHPSHIREGRYGDWLANNVDWALSRERYWGTPLPLWRCERCERTVAVGSIAELGERAGADLSGLDPHRPYVDEITFSCERCGEATMRRVPEVIDAWYDSGAMPFAQFGYPHAPGSAERLAAMFPADYIAEGIDQTRGWFYSLEAIATLLFDRNSYRRALCLGLLVDAQGRKMSKSAGNVLDPWTLIGAHGADALRWLLVVEGSPWQSRRVGDGPLGEVTRKLVLTLWNTYYFFVTYANLEGWTPERAAPPAGRRPIMDRYILAELAEATAEADAALADFNATRAGRRLAGFIDDLSNWYLRCSRDRFWNTDPDVRQDDTDAAFATLHTCLITLARLLAPLTPFLADELHENLAPPPPGETGASVHLTDYPSPDPAVGDDALRQAMAVARQLVTLGREARGIAGIPVRQPLRRALVTLPAGAHHLLDTVREVIAAELNVKTLQRAGEEDADTVSLELKPKFRALGPAFGKRTQAIAAAIRSAAPEAAVADLRERGRFTLGVDGRIVTLTGEHVEVIEKPVTAWQVAAGGAYSVALDLAIDQDLRLEGTAREFVRDVNDLRRRRGLELADRIILHVGIEDPGGDLARMLDAHGERVARDVLARTIVRHPGPAGDRRPDAGAEGFAPRWPHGAEPLRIGGGSVLVDVQVVGSERARGTR